MSIQKIIFETLFFINFHYLNSFQFWLIFIYIDYNNNSVFFLTYFNYPIQYFSPEDTFTKCLTKPAPKITHSVQYFNY